MKSRKSYFYFLLPSIVSIEYLPLQLIPDTNAWFIIQINFSALVFLFLNYRKINILNDIYSHTEMWVVKNYS